MEEELANLIWLDIVLIIWFFLILLTTFLYGRWCASGFKRAMDFEPKELRKLSSRTKAVLLKHKSEILKTLGGKQ